MATFVSRDLYDAMKADGMNMKGVWVEGTKVQAGKRTPQPQDYRSGNALQPNMRTSLFRDILGRAPRASEHERMSSMNSKSEMQQYAQQIQRHNEMRKAQQNQQPQAPRQMPMRPQTRGYAMAQPNRGMFTPQVAGYNYQPQQAVSSYVQPQQMQGLFQQQLQGAGQWDQYLQFLEQFLYGR